MSAFRALAANRSVATEPIRIGVLDMARHRFREDKARLEAQLAVVASFRAHGRPTEVAEMLVRAYEKFLRQSVDALAVAEVASYIDVAVHSSHAGPNVHSALAI
jgi:hypothetical protein